MLYALLCVRLFGSEVLWELETPQIRSTVVVTSPESFAVDSVRVVAVDYLKSNADKSYLQLDILTAANDQRLLGLMGSQKPRPMSYSTWEDAFRRSMNNRNAAAELIRVGTDAVLRICDANGAISKIVLLGGDPLLRHFNGFPVEIVKIALRTERYQVRRNFGFDDWDVEVFAEGDGELTLGTSEFVAKALEKWLGLGKIFLHLRNDDLFAGEARFPVRHLFLRADRWAVLPIREDYDKSYTYSCKRDSSGLLACHGSSFSLSMESH